MVSLFGAALVALSLAVRYALCPATEDGSRDISEVVFAVGCALIVLGFLPLH